MQKKTTNTFYVSVEGENSERLYLDWLEKQINQSNAQKNVKFVKKPELPISFAKTFVRGFEEFPLFHICDYEGETKDDEFRFKKIIDDINTARKIKGKEKKRQIKYNLCYTNLCFELWLILHKKKFNKPCNNKKDYLPEINELFGLNIKNFKEVKEKDNVEKILNQLTLNNVFDAIKNAKTLMKQCGEVNECKEYSGFKYFPQQPSLNLHEFFELVLKACGALQWNFWV